MKEKKEINTIHTKKSLDTNQKKTERFLLWISNSLSSKKLISNSQLTAFLKQKGKKILFFVLFLLTVLTPLYLYKQNEEKKRFLTTTRLSIMDKEVQRACNYIEKNFTNPQLNKESLCKALITGEAFLDALFLKELGISVENFINYVRINRAKFFLQQDKNCGIEELATKCGFSDSKILIETFEKITGKKIEDYRNALSS